MVSAAQTNTTALDVVTKAEVVFVQTGQGVNRD
jgi:hypothetical protein